MNATHWNNVIESGQGMFFAIADRNYPDWQTWEFVGWYRNGNEDADCVTYNKFDYFDGNTYLGPDDYGIEPMFKLGRPDADDWDV